MAIALKFSRATQPVLSRISCGIFPTDRRSYSSGPVSVKGRNFLTLKDFTTEEIQQFLWTAADLKHRYTADKEIFQPFLGKSVGMIFQKRSTRTRLSTETGVALLGGHACFLSPADVHLGVNESIRDSAQVISRFTDLILARVFSHDDLKILSEFSRSPIVNGLSDSYHPLQILADFQTLQAHFGYLRMLDIAFVGDGNNNITHSFMMGCPKLGINLRVASPEGFQPDPEVVKDAVALCAEYKTELKITADPMEAVYRADVVVTDTFVSMGKEEEKAIRLKTFDGFQVNRKMVNEMKANWVFLHCLPRKPEEVTDDVFYDREHSLVWDEAENRKWTVMAVMLHLLQDHTPKIPKPNFLYKP